MKFLQKAVIEMDTLANTLLYGEPIIEDECLCEKHGSRLRFHKVRGWICDDCDDYVREEELEEVRREHEEYIAQKHDMLQRGSCTMVQDKDFVAFTCKMPWWA